MDLVQPGSPVLLPEADKMINGPVICLFSASREITCRQLAHSAVIMQAVAAYSMLVAGIGTIAVSRVPFLIALHI